MRHLADCILPVLIALLIMAFVWRPFMERRIGNAVKNGFESGMLKGRVATLEAEVAAMRQEIESMKGKN